MSGEDRFGRGFEDVTGDPDDPAGRQGPKSVKDAWDSVLMYIPPELMARLERRFKELDLAAHEDGHKLQKSRHFYWRVVEAGLDALDDEEVLSGLED